MRRRHRQRDIWILVVGVLIVEALASLLPHPWLATSIVLAVVAVYIILALVLGWPLIGGYEPDPTRRTTPERAAALAAEIHGFAGDRKRDAPQMRSTFSGLSPEAQQLQHQIENEKYAAYSADTMARYAERYSARALGIFDEAVEAGLADPSDRWHLELPTNPLGVERAARIIGSIGESGV